ncbi:MAG: phosphate ABC transporter substrate-binding/OmpA family protein [Thermosynechococcaceae cyanobacterium]
MKLGKKFSPRSVAIVLLAYGVLIGGGYFLARQLVIPILLGNLDPTTGDVLPPVESAQLTLLGDTFSGYSTFRNDAFKAALQESGIQLNYRDEFNQATRAKDLSTGKADLMVTTLDQFLRHDPKGKIVGLIDRTIGADAAVLNTKQYPQLDSLLALKQLQNSRKDQRLSIVYAGDTPSEYLALVLDTKFDAFNLSEFNIIEVADSSDAWTVMQDESKDVAIAILWEPFVSKARKRGDTVVLSSRDTPQSIVDVIVASDRLIDAQPEQIEGFLETYYRRIDANMRSAAELQAQVAADGDLSPDDAATVLSGIDFFTATESKNWMERGTLKDRIKAISSVLIESKRLDAAPQNPEQLYTPKLAVKAAQNTQTLIKLIRADNPKLAARLEGTLSGQGNTQVSTAQIEAAQSIGNLQVQGEVNFSTGSANLVSSGTQTLDRLTSEIAEFNPDTVAVRVIGHTSKTGDAQINQILSQQRANVVAQYLKEKGLKQKIIAVGKGASEPRPQTSPGDPQNQRTEIRLVRIN